MVTVLCGGCGDRLGSVGSSSRSGNPRPVWRIEPGWDWSDLRPGRGTLERRDETFRSLRRLAYEVTARERPPEGFVAMREADLPIVVRCPRCHRIRWVGPEVALTAMPVGRR